MDQQEYLDSIAQQLIRDLADPNEAIIALALITVSNLATKRMLELLLPSVVRHLALTCVPYTII